MRTIKNLILVLVVSTVAFSCRKPVDPTPTQMASGKWKVENVITNEQQLDPDAYAVNSVLRLERNETYLFNNADGISTAGTWTADESKLTLTPDGNSAVTYDIVLLTPEKMHIKTKFKTFVGNDVELRYFLVRESL